MSFVCLRFSFQKFRLNKPLFQELSPKKAKKAKHFLNMSDGSLYGETIKVLMVHNILIYIHPDVHTNQEKYYITPLKP